MAQTTICLRHQLRRTLSRLTTAKTTTKFLIPYSSIQPPTATAVTCRNFQLSHSRLFSSASRSFNDIDKIDPDTILFEGCDYRHWLIVMDFGKDPNQRPPPDQMVETYVQTAAKVIGSVEEAKKKIYACSTSTYTGFQVEVDEEVSKKFEGLPGVIFVLPDSYIDPVNKEYGGDKYINGEIIPRPPPVQYGRPRRPNDQRPRLPMPNQQRNPAYNQTGNPAYNQPGNLAYNQPGNPSYNPPGNPAYNQPRNPTYNQQPNPAYNQQPNPAYNQQPNPAYNQQRNPPYNQQGNPAYTQQGNLGYNQQGNPGYNQQGNPPYNQQASTRGDGRGYMPPGPQQHGFQQQQTLSPHQNYPPKQNDGSFRAAPTSNFVPGASNSVPPPQQGNFNHGYNYPQGQMNNRPGEQGSYVPPGQFRSESGDNGHNHPQGQRGNYPGHMGNSGDTGINSPPPGNGAYGQARAGSFEQSRVGQFGQGAGRGYSQGADARYPQHGETQVVPPPSSVQIDPMEQSNFQPGAQTGFNQGRY